MSDHGDVGFEERVEKKIVQLRQDLTRENFKDLNRVPLGPVELAKTLPGRLQSLPIPAWRNMMLIFSTLLSINFWITVT